MYMTTNNEKHQFESLADKPINEVTMEDSAIRVTYCINKIIQIPNMEHRLVQMSKLLNNNEQKMATDKKKTVD